MLDFANSKRCYSCDKELPVDEFTIDRAQYMGLSKNCRACQKARREQLKQYRFNAKFGGLNGVLQKVYEAVPMNSPWTPNQIGQELIRTGRSAIGGPSLKGCLNSLTKTGLIREPTHGYFMRVAIEPDAPHDDKTEHDDLLSILDDVMPEVETKPTPVEPQPMTTKTETPIEKIGKLASQAQGLLALAKQLSADIETVAIEVEEMFSTRDAETAKLRQLQALLKSLG